MFKFKVILVLNVQGLIPFLDFSIFIAARHLARIMLYYLVWPRSFIFHFVFKLYNSTLILSNLANIDKTQTIKKLKSLTSSHIELCNYWSSSTNKWIIQVQANWGNVKSWVEAI